MLETAQNMRLLKSKNFILYVDFYSISFIITNESTDIRFLFSSQIYGQACRCLMIGSSGYLSY